MIRNTTTGRILAAKIVYCDTFFKRGTGLMLHVKNSVEDTGWIFDMGTETKAVITMFLVFFPIDIAFLDSDNRITELVHHLKPFSLYNSKKYARYFIEFNAGTLKNTKTKVGQKIIF